jgi:hypothetical protein
MEQDAPNEGNSVRSRLDNDLHLRLDDDLARALEDWRRRQEAIPSRPAAVRRLMARALADTTVAA